MFGIPFSLRQHTGLEFVQDSFVMHGNDLAEAARPICGATVGARVINTAVNFQAAARRDSDTRRDLNVLNHLLSFETVVDLCEADTWFYPHLDPASPAVKSIWFVTDRLTELPGERGELARDRCFLDPEHTMAMTRS
ncbi:hypothetical protein [Roseicyclus marinus]|uniref:hypothetical protein n=1 Tax=Roseicyclus marinus TaxID=2161673 RepID=UPI0024108E97|nr:hypothetical protein [Roseicyclus marinus]MDG3043122.1 hypothetical protein [Roseicyclus marinus]